MTKFLVLRTDFDTEDVLVFRVIKGRCPECVQSVLTIDANG